MNYTQAEARKEINEMAKARGLIIRKNQADKSYYVQERKKDGVIVLHHQEFWNMYHNFQSDFFDKYLLIV